MLVSYRSWLLACLTACCAAAAPAATLHGSVVRIVDGDTITVADGRHRKVKVRLSAIDAPEKQQAFGRQASTNLALLLLSRPVEVEWDKRDAYGRVVGRVRVAPPACANCGRTYDAGLAQVGAGYAWWYRSESRELSQEDKARYALAENAARTRHLGLWVAPQPVPPWQWRHSQAQTGNSATLLVRTGARIKQAKRIVLHPARSMRRWVTLAASR